MKKRRPRGPEDYERLAFYDPEQVASATECTGLIPRAILTEDEARAYASLYALHRNRPSDP